MCGDEKFMQRCIELALSGMGNVSPNPMVGAVVVHNDRIIGEGYHQKYGEAHAEVNAINQVMANHANAAELLKQSAIYVSLEPCAHYGKTPPCADLIIKHQIPRAIIGCRDPFAEVDGKGMEKLAAAGITLTTGVLEKECRPKAPALSDIEMGPHDGRFFCACRWFPILDKRTGIAPAGTPVAGRRRCRPGG
jgi:diaminohydroxyphosphoribosylaminopyrimidine deaminase/5-amino-6-(5-phosphoribosylamino)uracil reductase